MRKVLTLRGLSATLLIAATPVVAAATPPAASTVSQAEVATAPPATAPRTVGTVVDVAANDVNFTTLVTAIKAANLVGPLSGSGPFTVFAPTDDAFAKLPAGTVDNLVKPESKTALSGLLAYHVVAGRVSAADLMAQISAGGGTASLTTLSGGTLTATLDGDAVVLTDAKGGKARVIAADVAASNGVIHAIDAVVMP